MNNFNLEIISPDGIMFNREIWHCQVPGYAGSMGVLSNHISFFTVFDIGIVKININESGNEKEFFAVAGGVVQIENNRITILGESVENGKNIDIKRAREAERNNLIKLEKTLSSKEREKFKALIAKARNRIHVFESFQALD